LTHRRREEEDRAGDQPTSSVNILPTWELGTYSFPSLLNTTPTPTTMTKDFRELSRLVNNIREKSYPASAKSKMRPSRTYWRCWGRNDLSGGYDKWPSSAQCARESLPFFSVDEICDLTDKQRGKTYGERVGWPTHSPVLQHLAYTRATKTKE